jgi:hypothetical protein
MTDSDRTATRPLRAYGRPGAKFGRLAAAAEATLAQLGSMIPASVGEPPRGSKPETRR